MELEHIFNLSTKNEAALKGLNIFMFNNLFPIQADERNRIKIQIV